MKMDETITTLENLRFATDGLDKDIQIYIYSTV